MVAVAFGQPILQPDDDPLACCSVQGCTNWLGTSPCLDDHACHRAACPVPQSGSEAKQSGRDLFFFSGPGAASVGRSWATG
jgi:hypothetical protein